MKQKILFLVTLVLLAVQGWAAPVDLSKAQAIAQSFASANGHFNAQPLGYGLKLAHAEPSGKLKEHPVFYVFNSSDSYVIVAGDDRAEQVLGYGEGQFDINDIPCGMRDLFNVYKEEIEFLQTHPKYFVEKVPQGNPSFNATSVSPLLSTKWDQGSPYYNHCPSYDSNSSHHCLTGCVATAMAQVMQYWKYPSSAPAMSAYTTKSGISVTALSSKSLTWSTSNDAVAWLMRYAGQSVQMNYGKDASGVTNENAARNALVNKFSYSSSATLVKKANYTVSAWNTKIKNELNAGHPVYYQAYDSNGYGGHAFVLDGYNSSSKYHINWGWSGSYNGYYALDAFNPSNGYKYNSNQSMIVDLRPQTILSINPNPVAFTNKTVGVTYTASISIKGYDLTGDLTLKLTGATGVFSINKTSITKSAATSGTTVTVTYKPTAAGTQTATLTISGGGLTSNKTVSIKGTSVVRTITTSPTSLAFGSVIKGKSVSKTIKVTGTNLTGSLTLSTNSSYYTVSPTTITAAEAKAGKTVTVTYKATAKGTNNAILTIKGGSAADKKVNLTGKCIVPLITTSVSSLNFDKNISKSFKVTGSDLTGNLTLIIKGTGKSYFTLSKTSITASAAASGVTVSVLCNVPNNLQRATAQVVISGGSAPSKTITLSYAKNQPVMISSVEPEGGIEDGNEELINGGIQSANGNRTSSVNELAMNSRIYADGHSIIIESSVGQEAIISDISGRAQRVNLQAGRNEIPVNASGVYIVRIREKTAKLMIK